MKLNKKNGLKWSVLVTGSVILPAMTPPAFAQQKPATLDPVVVSAPPVIEANRVDNFGSLRTDVTDTQVRDLNAIDLSSALRRTPGVSISRFNPVGSFGGNEGGGVFIRGQGASRPGSEIKTYIDGVPFYMGVWNHPLLDLLPVNGMERISVYKSPQPQSFGNTFGAIDLTPKRARSEGIKGDFTLQGGSYNTFIEQADLVGRRGDLDISLAQSYARSNGHRDDADGRLANVMGRLGYRISSEWSVGLTFLHVDNKVRDPGQQGLPATKTGRYDTSGSLAAATLQHDHGWAKGSLKLYTNSGHGDWLGQPALDGDTLSDFKMSGLRWREQIMPWKGGEIVVGMDVDGVKGNVAFNRIAPAPTQYFSGQTLRITSPYVGLNQTVDLGQGWAVVPSIGTRWYDHNELKSSSAPHAGIVLKKSDVFALRANASRGINYPGLDAAVLSFLIPPLGQSWKQLDPERVDHQEIGISLTPGSSTTIDLSLFEDRVKNRYIFAFPPTVPAPGFVNLGNYKVRGAEASLQQQVTRNFDLFAGLTLMDPSLDSLPYAPKTAVVLGATWHSGPWRVSADAQYQSGMYVLNQARADGVLNTSKVSSFTVANIRASYKLPSLGPRGEVFVAIENLFDEKYAFRPGYPMPGVSGRVGVNMSF